ncbi:hypothetical protein [Ancylobacter sp. SL191]|uniref:hypothetical protein n=1 Tax=Ancylobacter sp. SL191 TaxID=2995166 RepID=UPI00226DBA32|nr:hypothetical protein [Ancylobacter sp. SL191]WAC27885.1 hypothetical protein OU996_02055 [Ancylobacter sp. SL191]
MRIQLDMFAVELGAAILLQFETPDGAVRVLADGGEAKYHIDTKLADAMASFDGKIPKTHIDLIVGTHYDADHLAGLVDIVQNSTISIGEAWLPPVANDTEPKTGLAAPGDAQLLALQFAGDDGERVLRDYLASKARTCARFAQAERWGDEFRSLTRDDDESDIDKFVSWTIGRPDGDVPDLALFEWHLRDASRTLGRDTGDHAEAVFDDLPEQEEDADPFYRRRWVQSPEALAKSWSDFSDRAEVEAPALALIRASAAKDAINATSLKALVDALKKRRTPIACRTIKDGQPRRFVWSKIDRRFLPGAQIASDGPELLLLGPSDGLVKKHWRRLPIGDYVMKVAYAALPIEPITPSNQLSYIMRMDFGEARILISGDAGCVDFKPSPRADYHPELIAALSPLHVIQVAHHGGHNAHFYRCLLAADYQSQTAPSYLLLSHGTYDKHRPSAVFAKFIETVRRDGDDVQLLFTSTPEAAKVKDFKALFAPVVGTAAQAGDVKLVFDGSAWAVAAHAVEVP